MCSLCSFSLYYCINYNLQTVSDQWLRIDIFLAEILQFLLHFWFEYIKYIFWSERWIYYIEHEMACGCWKWMVYIFGMTDLKCKALKFSVLEVKKKKMQSFLLHVDVRLIYIYWLFAMTSLKYFLSIKNEV